MRPNKNFYTVYSYRYLGKQLPVISIKSGTVSNTCVKKFIFNPLYDVVLPVPLKVV
jgi:hypothetical protein